MSRFEGEGWFFAVAASVSWHFVGGEVDAIFFLVRSGPCDDCWACGWDKWL